MSTSETTFKLVNMPIGAWDINGGWQSNPNLNMTETMQIRHNIIGGHFDLGYRVRQPMGFLVAEKEKTLFEKIAGFFKQ